MDLYDKIGIVGFCGIFGAIIGTAFGLEFAAAALVIAGGVTVAYAGTKDRED